MHPHPLTGDEMRIDAADGGKIEEALLVDEARP